jgi:hypothetical protein
MQELITRVKSSTRGISEDTQNFLDPSRKCRGRQAGKQAGEFVVTQTFESTDHLHTTSMVFAKIDQHNIICNNEMSL